MFTIIQKGFLFLITLTFAISITGCGGGEGACCEDGTANNSLVKNIEIKEGHLYSFTLPTEDENGNTLIYKLFENPSHGVLSGEVPNIVYTPNDGFVGTDRVKYKVKVKEENKVRAADVTLKDVGIYTIYIVVKEHKHAPSGVKDSATTNENTPIVIDVLINDKDTTSDNPILTITTLTQPSHGSAEIIDEKIKYTPSPNYKGMDSFTYIPSNETGDGNVTTVTINVADINNIPVGVNDTIVINEDASSITFDVLSNDTDGDGDTLTITNLTQPSKGTLSVNSNMLSYIPNINVFGIDTFTYTPNDGVQDGNSVTVTINITNINDKPLSTDDFATTPEDTKVTINVLGNDADADADVLSITNLSTPLYGTVVINANKIIYTPNPNISDINDTFTYTPYDGTIDGPVATVTVTISNINDAPIGGIDNAGTFEDNSTIIEVLKNDIDLDSDTLTITNLIQPAHGTAEIIGTTIKYTPAENYNGTDTFTYTPNDGTIDGNLVTVRVLISPVSDVPVGIDDSITIDEDSEVTIDVLANDMDAENDPLTITNLTNPSKGSVDIIDGKIKYIPEDNDYGTYTFTYTPHDSEDGKVATVTVIVKSVNDKPVGEVDSDTIDEDTNTTISVLTNDSDIDGDTLSIENLTQPANGVTVKNGTTIKYTPNANFNGTDIFKYTPNDGTTNGNEVNVTITVTSIEDIPEGINDAITINEDTVTLIDVLANDKDGDGDTLSITNLTLSEAPKGAIALVDGKVQYTPNNNAYGIDTFTYTPNDSKADGNEVTVTVTITSVNDIPVGAVESITTNEDTVIVIDVLANDTDSDDATLTISDLTQPSHGTTAVSTGKVAYTPVANYHGADSFTYRPYDSKDKGDVVIVTVEVSSVLDAPVGVNDAKTTSEDTATTIDVLANDSDGDGDALIITNLSVPSNGTAVIEGSSVKYTPKANFKGTDTFTYTPNDGSTDGNEVTVTVTVTTVNDLPVGVVDSASTDEDTSVSIDVLQNDTDVDGNSLTITSLTDPSHGTTVVSAGKVTYIPTANYHGSDSFTYTPNDGIANGNIVTVSITVNDINDVPVGVADSVTTNEDTQVTLYVLTNDTDEDGDTLSITNLTDGGHGTTVQNGTAIVYTPEANFNGTDTFTYTPNDGSTDGVQTTVTVTVTAVTDAIIGYADNAETNENSSVLIDVLANDTNVDGVALSIKITSFPAHGLGTGAVVENGKIRYTPISNYFGTDTFTYKPTDNGTEATVTITINPCMEKIWDKTITNAQNHGVAIDNNVIYVVGETSDSTAFIAEYDGAGVRTGKQELGENTSFADIKVATDGSHYVVGSQGTDGMIVKYNSAGAEQWTQIFAGTGNETFTNLVLDADGNIYVVGKTNSSDGDITDGNGGANDALIVKYNSAGVYQWDKTFGDAADESFASIAINGTDLYAVGQTTSDILVNSLIVKFNTTNGAELWNIKETDPAVDYFNGVAIDADGNPYAVGYSQLGGADNGYRVKYDSSNGNKLLEKRELLYDYKDITIGSNGDIYIAGVKGSSAILRRYSADATTILCERIIGSSSFSSVAIDNNNGFVYSAGQSSTDALIYKWKPLNN